MQDAAPEGGWERPFGSLLQQASLHELLAASGNPATTAELFARQQQQQQGEAGLQLPPGHPAWAGGLGGAYLGEGADQDGGAFGSHEFSCEVGYFSME